MRILLVILTALSLLLASGCGGGFAENCSDDFDCRDICVRGPEFPGGFCSFDCESDDDCPSDAFCIAHNADAICAMACADDDECQMTLENPNYMCANVASLDGMAMVDVCLAN